MSKRKPAWYLEEIYTDILVKNLKENDWLREEKEERLDNYIKWGNGERQLTYDDFSYLIKNAFLFSIAPTCYGVIYYQNKIYHVFTRREVMNFIKEREGEFKEEYVPEWFFQPITKSIYADYFISFPLYIKQDPKPAFVEYDDGKAFAG